MLDCIVIGAGPGGLVCTKELLEQGLREIVCLEQARDVGGVFANTYDSLLLTSSATMSMFSDFWIGDGNQHTFWTKEEAVDYWKRYAQHFGVLERIRFNSKVVNIVPQGSEGWQVQLASGETLLSKRIALAIGNNTIPKYPAWKDLLTDVEYSHSKEYRNADSMAGKNVLVIGGGESGSDIALEASRVASNCWVSLRETTGWVAPRKRGIYAADISTHRGVWGLPRDYGAVLSEAIDRAELSQNDPVHNVAVELNKKIKAQKRVWGIYGTKTFSLPKAIAHHGCQVVGEIVKVEDGGRTVITADGQTISDIDHIVFSTGYKNYVPFLPEEIKETDPRSLYKHMFHPKYRDKIVWIGWARPSFGSQFPIMEMQARLFAAISTGEKTLPVPTEMERVTCVDRLAYLEQFEHNAHRVRSLVDYHRYMDDMAGLIGCEPPLWKYFFLHPRIWLRMVYGATQATQFRLRGPGHKKSLAQKLLMKLPVSKPTHIVKAGLRGRVIYAFKSLIPKFGFVGFKGSRNSSSSVAVSRVSSV
ncbi:MAG: NAD(P)-binding domain-containing protein [Xenococcaceae cyanobacterium MO_188.B29]|nr:NAD(P)-binding domain-containing protein [Xenococcaceae cyanobacterium MO_188.B29]